MLTLLLKIFIYQNRLNWWDDYERSRQNFGATSLSLNVYIFSVVLGAPTNFVF